MTGRVPRFAVLAVCPRCRRRFGHAAALLAHARRTHPGTSRRKLLSHRGRILSIEVLPFARDFGTEEASQEEAAMR